MASSTFPPPPNDALDWDNIGFKMSEVNGHIESSYSTKTGKWTTPEFVADPYLRLHGMSPGLNYGQQCFEGLKAFRSPDDKTINVFRPDQNALRLQHSCDVVSIPPIPTDLFLQCINLSVALNASFVPPHRTGAALYIRPVVFGSCAQLGLNPPEEYLFCVYVVPTGVYHGSKPVEALVLEDFDRAAPVGTGNAKLGGNYGPVLKWSQKAYAQKFGITLHLDSKTRTEVDEFSTSGFIGLHKNKTSTEDQTYTLVVPNSSSVIKSVTSESVCDLARGFGWTVEKRPIKYEEISTFDEICAAGTAAALVPIKGITMKSKGDKFTYLDGADEPGPACVKLLTTLQGIQRAKVPDENGWLYQIKAPQQGEYSDRGQGGTVVDGENANGVNGQHVDKLP